MSSFYFGKLVKVPEDASALQYSLLINSTEQVNMFM